MGNGTWRIARARGGAHLPLIIVAVLAVELLSAVLVVFLSYGYERHTHFHAFDVLLFGQADAILGAVQDAEDAQDNLMLVKADLHVPPGDIYEVYDRSRGMDYDSMRCGRFQLTRFHAADETILDLL